MMYNLGCEISMCIKLANEIHEYIINLLKKN
jgi:hypothetical protein